MIVTNKLKTILLVSIVHSSAWCTSPTTQDHDIQEKTEFVVVIPSYNNQDWCESNLDSIVNQKSSEPFKIIYINDCSTDKTGEIVDNYVKKKKLKDMIQVIHNKKNVGALENYWNVIHKHIPDHKVVVTVDGDDFLIADYVLLRLEEEYKNPNTWMTYGSYVRTNGKPGLAYRSPNEYFEKSEVRRKWGFPFHHLRTFKAGLFKKIKKEDLMHEGRFYPMSWDLAMMYPMAEMACPKGKNSPIHAAHIPDILYLYNMNNPISDRNKNYKFQIALGKEIRKKRKYAPIGSLNEEPHYL